MDQKGLKLAKWTTPASLDTRLRYHRGYIKHDIAPGGIKYQAINRLPERRRPEEGRDNHKGPDQRDGRAESLCNGHQSLLLLRGGMGDMVVYSGSHISFQSCYMP